jgi:hypothetical protein
MLAVTVRVPVGRVRETVSAPVVVAAGDPSSNVHTAVAHESVSAGAYLGTIRNVTGWSGEHGPPVADVSHENSAP